MCQPFPPPSFQSPPPAAQPVHPAAHQKAEWVYAASEETFEKRLQQELKLADIQVELCQGNYKRKFHHLICWEEKAHVEILGNKCDQTCNLVLFSSKKPPNWIRSRYDYAVRYGFLQNVSTDVIAYVTQASEAAFIVPRDESLEEVRLEVLRENFNRSDTNLYVAFSEADSHNLSAIISKPISGSEVSIPDVCVEFEVKHFYFNSLIKAVNKISNVIIGRILPTALSFNPLRPTRYDIMSLLQHSVTIDRENQWKALHAILAFDPSSPPLLINGSFGTGKTQVLAAATYCLIQDGIQHSKPVRVLICAHHQASADHFVEKYFGSMFEHTRDVVLIRLTSKSYRVRNSKFPNCYVKSLDLKKYLGRNAPQFLAIVTTFLTAPSLQWSCDQNFFTHILLDEGSQSREPEAIAPLCLANINTKIVIAGDSQQVGPSLLVLGEEARENGLKFSLLERLQILYKECGGLALDHMVSLDTNYRCREELIRIPNELFYGSKIKTKASPHQLPSMYTYPLKFVCSSITEETDANREAMLLLKETRQFIESSRSCSVEEICAVTASRTQLVISRNVARNRFKDLRRIRMLTTYEIQGQEFQALFLSTTEPMDEDGNTTNPTKSPCDPYIFNTVLTRSKSLVVVVGNPVALLNIERHMKVLYGKKAQCWSSFIRLCLEKGSFHVPPEVEPDQLKRREFELRFKESHHTIKGGAQSISSPNVSVPESHSSFYDEYKNKLESHRYILEQELTAENYKEKFHLLLSWEEQEHAKQLAERCDKVYDVALYQNGFNPPGLRYEEKFDRFGYITSDDGDTLNHAEQASQGSFIILDANSFVHAHHVYATPSQKVNVNSIIVGFRAGDHNKLKKSSVYQRIAFSFKAEVKFELKHSYFERCHKAVRYLTLNTVQRLNPTRSCLEPDRSEYIPGVPPYDNIKLDQVQLKALCGTLSSSRASPILIAGPFGTGKTRLLARAAYEILKGRNTRVLICAHHQTSVDTFVDYFSEMKQSGWDIGVIRVVPNQTYFHPERAKKGVTLKTRYELSQNDLENNRLVIATLGVAPTLFFKLPGDRRKGFFTDILIDEGAQTREPEAVGPLGLAGRYTRIIVAGDHCQVGPKSVVLGEEAQSNGLGVSLLERLHALYDKFDPKLNTGSMTLLTNYRCHSGILMLPSSLYYHSTLQCRVPDSTAHHLAPFPLTFVCSSIQQDLKGTSGSDESEADAIVKEVQKYFKKWPKHWDGDKEDRKVCIMSPSADQCSVLRRKTRQKNFEVDCHVEILKGYTIQGTQYRAVFISAIEPTSENGDPINTTKSLCDRYIFNTTITRSQSLVVVVGNPFLLLKMEANMIASHDKSYQTWTPYIKQCMECNTFSYADSLKRDDPSVFIQATHQLYQCVYRDTICEDSFTSRPLDSIIRAYKKLFESTPECQKAKLALTSGKDARLLWSIEEERNGCDVPAEEEEQYSDRYLCNLKMYTFRYAEGIPYDGTKSIVKFHDVKYRRGAFDGDTVEVGITENDSPGKCYGRILKVTERGSDLKFVCRVSTDNPIIFYPIDRKNPKLLNLPRISRDLLNKKERAEINRSDLKSNDVVVFSPLSHDTEGENGDVPLPQIVQVIPLSVARDMLFLVSFVRWDEKYPSPLGIVTGAYRKGHTLYNAERLLKFVHSVEYNSTGEGSSATVSDAHRDVTLELYDRAFTIDPEDAQNLDDALSIIKLGVDKKGCKVYQLGVHIVNAARHITPGSEEDMRARNKGISVYGGDKGKIMHMLQSSLTRCQLSLAPGKVRDVITVTCTITVNDTITFGDVSIQPAQLLSSIQLTYKQAQEIMEGRIPDNCVMAVSEFDEDIDNPTMQQSLEILYNIARDRRQKRLQDAAFAYDINKTKEAHCWQTHLLVEELMIWANNEVAKHIHSLYPNTAILRKQAAPNEEAKNAIVDSNHSAMAFSFHLSQYLEGREDSSVDLKLAIPHSTLKQIHKALDENDSNFLAHLLSSDRLYPQLAAVCSEFRSISLRSVYCCTSSQASSQDYRHDSLHLDQYTHFTSPMRRYVDIAVQRMLLELSDQRQEREFIPEKQTELCLALNTKKRNASDFERSLKNVRFARRLTESSEVCTAFISKEEKNSIELSFPDLELSNFPVQAKSLRITSFVSSEEGDLYEWKVHITTLKSDFATGLLSLQGTSVHQFNAQLTGNQDLVKAFTASSETSLDTERFSLSHDNSTVFVPSTQWAEVQEFVKNPSARKMEKVRQIIPQLPQPKPQGKGVSKIYQFLDCDIKASLKKSDVLKLWLTWSTREPVISPAVQLVEISPLLRICLQHNSHPAECFSDPNILPASKPVYSSIEAYVDLWKKVLLAEAAEKSVKECQPIIIRDVSLTWPPLKIPDNCIEEIYYVPTGPVEMTLPKHFIEHCYEFFRVGVGDLVCVRYGCDPHQSARAVYHFVIHEVKEKEPVCAKGSTSLSRILEKGEPDEGPKEITIAMVPVGEKNCRVSQVMRDQLQSPCEVQLLELSVSYRKVFRGLLDLSEQNEDKEGGTKKVIKLSQAVAVDYSQIRGQTYHEVITQRDELSKSISKWSSDAIHASTNLNEWQEKAMRKALKHPFQLIQGPPGTGKSVTGAHIAYVFAKLNKSLGGNECVLYCGPSNKSVDVVFEKFVQLLESRKVDIRILRIYSSTVEKKDFPGPKYRTAERKPDVVCHDWARPYALHHLIRQQPESGKLRELEEKIAGMKRNNEIATGKLCSEYNHVKQEAVMKFLSKEKFDIIFCTCNEASGQMKRSFKTQLRHFIPRQCIIDECGMAYEPETIVPIDLCEHAVLIGDHKQLQPVIDYQPAKDCGLTTSLFERYAQHHDKFIFTLKTQYRMHEDICEFPSKEFYKEELKTDISVLKRPPNERLDTFWRTCKGNTTPIMFVDLVGEEGRDKTGSSKTDTKVGVDSKYNMKEAELVVKIAKTLHQNYKVPVREMAVLSPYSAQKSKILEMVKQLPSDMRRLKVASITESQGDEYGIVILSTVRSQPLEDIRLPHYVQADRTWMRENLGFITDRHQINVGITRSKYGLIITGNKTLLEYDRTWENLLKHYEKKGCVIQHRKLPRAVTVDC